MEATDKKINLPLEEIMSLKIFYNFLEGINLPDNLKNEKRHFILRKNDEEAKEISNLFEQMFNKKLIYLIKGKNCYFAYKD
jgi:hypothetical protein